MSKLVYMEQTLNILGQKDLKATKLLVESGTIKETELIKYLVV